jgi:hypothetical protein
MATNNASSWKNGSPNYETGAGLGINILSSYQDVIFDSGFNTIELYHCDRCVSNSVNVLDKKCLHLINTEIGLWLIANGWHQWVSEHPHRFTITQVGTSNRFNIQHQC